MHIPVQEFRKVAAQICLVQWKKLKIYGNLPSAMEEIKDLRKLFDDKIHPVIELKNISVKLLLSHNKR